MTTGFSPITSVQTRIHDITTAASGLRDIDAKIVGNDDECLLAEIGYKQELKRRFSTFQVFGIAYSIMGILPSASSLLGTALVAGPAGAIWSWVVASIFILTIGISMSELASAIPTSGGLYYWTFYYAPEAWRVPLSFFIGLSNTMALCSGSVSVFYGNAEEILAAVYLTNNDFVITNGKTYGVFAACLISGALATCLSSKNVAMLQTISSVCHTGLLILFFIALPIGTKINRGEFNDRGFIFGEVQNWSDWPIGWQFCLSFMTAVWTIGGFDSCVHMSEEAKNASYGVPIGICSSITVCGFIGFFILVCTASCMNPDVVSVLQTDSGFPMAQVIHDSLGNNWAIAFMSLMAACQWLMGSSLVTAASRQIWAFSRDDGLPFCDIVKVVNKKLKVPLRAVILSCLISLTIGCLCLAGSAAANALFSLSVLGNYVAWCTPIFLKLTYGKHKFRPGNFYLGDVLSPILGWISCAWGLFIMVLVCFPATKKVDKTDMNYCVVITVGVWLLSLIFFFTYKYKYYHGPKSNLDDEKIEEVSSIEEIALKSIEKA
ncbi:GABA-specific high-affinity permease [Pichia californica]|uniref:GABA-specific high-affinity permease n=1 Tax=Pichia californica TaxID=460514 RepID=A0A9P7BI30_9ASCO|nr:GABA-specific high-affinity permease [[Candida] californica]KAG0690889.1 GABA-specific high-affinity permease [[Candida] californica]